MKTHKDLTINDFEKINKLSKGCRITMKRLGEIIPLISKEYELSLEEAFEAIKYTRHMRK